MQDRGNDGFNIEAQIGKNPGDRHRMGDVGLAALARLPMVRLGTELIGTAHAFDLIGAQISGKLVFERNHIRGQLATPCAMRINRCLHQHLAVASNQTAAR